MSVVSLIVALASKSNPRDDTESHRYYSHARRCRGAVCEGLQQLLLMLSRGERISLYIAGLGAVP